MSKCGRCLFLALVPTVVLACDSSVITGVKSNSIVIQSTGDSAVESEATDSSNIDNDSSDVVYAPYCQEEPFKTLTSGTYRGVLANELFSESSRCEFDVTLTIDSVGADNQSCEQTGVLSFSGTQTVSSDYPSVCANVEDQSVTIGWNLQEFIEVTASGSQVELVQELSYPVEAFVSTWGIELLPDEDEQGTQIEYPGLLYSLDLHEDLTITGGNSELFSGLLRKVE